MGYPVWGSIYDLDLHLRLQSRCLCRLLLPVLYPTLFVHLAELHHPLRKEFFPYIHVSTICRLPIFYSFGCFGRDGRRIDGDPGGFEGMVYAFVGE